MTDADRRLRDFDLLTWDRATWTPDQHRAYTRLVRWFKQHGANTKIRSTVMPWLDAQLKADPKLARRVAKRMNALTAEQALLAAKAVLRRERHGR